MEEIAITFRGKLPERTTNECKISAHETMQPANDPLGENEEVGALTFSLKMYLGSM